MPAIVAIIAAAAAAVLSASPALATSPTAEAARALATPPEGAAQAAGELHDTTRGWGLPITAGVSLLCIMTLALLDVFRPGGLDKKAARNVAGLPAAQWAFAALLVFAVHVFATSGIVELGLDPNAEGARLRTVALYHLANAAAFATAALGMLLLLSPRVPNAGAKFGPADPFVALMAFVLVYPPIVLAGAVAADVARRVGAEPAGIAHTTLATLRDAWDGPDTRGWAVVMILALTVLVPIAEECLYRGLVQSAVRRVVRSAWAAVLITAAGFTALHYTAIPDGQHHALVPIFVLAVAMGAAFERTKRIAVPIVMHALFNAANIAQALAAG